MDLGEQAKVGRTLAKALPVQAAAVEAWQAAAARKDMGQVLSRDDLAGYFTRAHSKAIPETRSQRHMDPADYTVKFGTNSTVRLLLATGITVV